jgi:hypothetical protein
VALGEFLLQSGHAFLEAVVLLLQELLLGLEDLDVLGSVEVLVLVLLQAVAEFDGFLLLSLQLLLRLPHRLPQASDLGLVLRDLEVPQLDRRV